MDKMYTDVTEVSEGWWSVFTSEVVQGRAAHCVELESPGCLCCLVRPSHWENITITKYLERSLKIGNKLNIDIIYKMIEWLIPTSI